MSTRFIKATVGLFFWLDCLLLHSIQVVQEEVMVTIMALGPRKMLL